MTEKLETREGNKNIIREEDTILIVYDIKRRWIRKVKKGEQFHCNKGFFEYNTILGKKFGSTIHTNKAVPLYIYRPILTDYFSHFKFKSQIIYPKDLGYILTNGGIVPGSRVIETGTGSGGLTSLLATYVQPNGHVYTYEKREKAVEAAKENITQFDLDKFITFHIADASEGFKEKNVDTIVIDVAEPWTIAYQ